MSETLGGADLGGSHIAASILVDAKPTRVVHRRFAAASRTAADTLDLIAECLSEAGEATRWMIAAPGPFEYQTGRCLISGLSKLEELFDVNLRIELSERLPGTSFDFVNDAQAAGIGEWASGAGERAQRMLYVGIGTGLGSVFINEGAVVDRGDQVPPGGHLGLTTFRDGLADDYCSTRRLLASSDHANAELLVQSARDGSSVDLARLAELGADLEEIMSPWVARFKPERIVVGGGLSRAYELILRGFTNREQAALCVAASYPHDAALHGVAVLAGNPNATSSDSSTT